MRVPLDYYRILGLPIQATAEQLKQAHRDRTQQLPRREYSEAAIAARRELLDEAYDVLSNPEQRQSYDSKFLVKSYDLDPNSSIVISSEDLATPGAADPYSPSIEIDDHQLVGALLILLELGEYELILKLGLPYLSGDIASLTAGRFGQPEVIQSDIVLTVAFACLELGREQWQQGQYENAAESLEIGQALLLREGLFPMIRGEMQADLYKLRPYRVLELLALPETEQQERQKGVNLLQDMLQDRGGIDGSGNDQSGLNVDDFLRFVQQLRSYLTSAEQQTLFEAEARRPSAVATYLAVYALLARGFAERQPALIRRAKLMLIRLGTRQDVHLEQAVCALLLGQTEEASRALDRSQEFESLAFIRENSQGSPDLLPGLCLYGERWLQNEVFPHFRDLVDQTASLKDYFADKQVQEYLEELPNEPETLYQLPYNQPSASVNGSYRSSQDRNNSSTRTMQESGATSYGSSGYSGATATLEATTEAAPADSQPMPTAERVSRHSPEAKSNGGGSMSSGGGRLGRSTQTYADRGRRGTTGTTLRPPNPAFPSRRIGGRRLRLDRLLFLVAMGVLGLGLLVVLLGQLTRPSSSEQTADVKLNPQFASLILKAIEPVRASAVDATLNQDTAKEVIETWFEVKAAAYGENHEVDRLSEILAEPSLAAKQAEAERLEADNTYVNYKHTVDVVSVTSNEETPDQAEVLANVVETAEYYNDDQLDLSSSYDSTLQVRYNLVRQDDRWLIQDWTAE